MLALSKRPKNRSGMEIGLSINTVKEEPLHFRISAALKRVLGRDLITDDLVAIFELVKNGFDARATHVHIVLTDDRLFVVDDGKGMSYDDILRKWLFVAYSAKSDGTEDDDYRGRIGAHRPFAGSKGVGRFSCDRLGQNLRMQTAVAGGDVQIVTVDWKEFEVDPREEFAEVDLGHSVAKSFELPTGIDKMASGTILEISGLREGWDREKLIRLRSALAKLINPFEAHADAFEITLTVPSQESTDADIIRKDGADTFGVVNGRIQNFIFDTLGEKTTHLTVELVDNGLAIQTTLTDRGALIYRIKEKNETYPLLVGVGFSCNIYYLNRSAKATFARRMGMPSTQFGSVFLFKNGFRIYPVGEVGVDTFGIDRRKAQGYNRFLGTRDVIGRIDVTGSDEVFRESTSRDQGLIETPAYSQLEDLFVQRCLRRLERYVVGVSWADALDLDVEDVSRISGDAASARITSIVSQLVNTDGVELIDYNRDLIRILNERSDVFSSTLVELRTVARRSGDEALLRQIEDAGRRFDDLQRAEAAARESADRERDARREAERTTTAALRRADLTQKAYDEERKRNLFLTSLTSIDRESVEILHHQIIIHAAAVNEIINSLFDRLKHGERPTIDDLFGSLENISFQNKKILSTARFATRANFRLDSESIDEDLAAYFVQYIEQVAPMFTDSGIRILAKNNNARLLRRFKPIEVSILVDNLVSNAGRAGASEIRFELDQPRSGELRIVVEDDGSGFDDEVQDPSRFFEKGFTTSEGSGLGLYHVKQILDDLGGSITAEREASHARFIIRVRG